MRRPERTTAHGLIAGLVGATILALWFLIIDTAQGRPLHTPAFLASVLAGVEEPELSVRLVVLYTLLHYAAFLAVGVAVAWLTSKLEAWPSFLLGLVLGFVLFDLVFYFGIIFTGVDIVDVLGWAEVLSGNLLAGVGLMAYLRTTTDAPRVTWWQALAEHRIVNEGVIAGLLGAGAVAFWFLIFDFFRGRPFFTPGALGSAVLLGTTDPAQIEVNILTVAGYSVVHVAAFLFVGLAAAAIAVQAEQTPPVLLAGLLLFATFEAFFLGLLAVVAEWLLGTLGWVSVGTGNLIATVVMAYYLWRRHPRLRAALRQETLSDETLELAGGAGGESNHAS